jgi:hypothetical protein
MTRKYWTIMYLVLFVFLSACNADSYDYEGEQKEKQLLLKENELLKKENKLLRMKRHQDSIALLNMEENKTVLPTEQQPANVQSDSPIRVGQHDFTLQWIGWEAPGKVDIIQLEDNKYKIAGKQESNKEEDYVSIDGELTVLDDKTLLFEGELVSRVSFINEGNPCIRTEPLHFRVTGNRKYWRLQEKQSCEGENTVDYVDIYF